MKRIVFFIGVMCSCIIHPSSIEALLIATEQSTETLYENLPQIMPVATVWLEAATTSVQQAFKQQKSFFEQDCKRYAFLNKRIPQHTKNDGILRIVTYNIDYKRSSPTHLSSEITNVIKELDADILILQEVPVKKTTKQRKQLAQEVKALFAAFDYTHVGVMRAHEDFANVVLSKPGLTAQARGAVFGKQGQTASKTPTQRSYVRVDYTEKNNKPLLTVFGTHLELRDEEIRDQQLLEIMTDAQSGETENVLIAGDFNAVRKKDYDYTVVGNATAWELLVKRYQSFKPPKLVPTKALDFLASSYLDCFEKAQAPGPKFTAENGLVLDHIFVHKNWTLPLKGCYVYYSDASDHLPVIMDIEIS